MKLFKFMQFLSKRNKSLFDITVEDQLNYLNSLPDPQDDIDRSYNQYLCQSVYVGRLKKLLFNSSSFILVLPIIIYLLIKRINCSFDCKVESVGEFKDLEEVIPAELYGYKINNDCWSTAGSLSCHDLIFAFTLIKRHFFSPWFNLKCILKIAMYSNMIKKYEPSRLVVHNEYSFTSSILTLYCNLHNISHINCLHGEKLFYMRDSFFHYNQCYVWDSYYSTLFIKLRAHPEQFTISIPPSLQIHTKKYKDKTKFSDYKYYLQEYTESQLVGILESMKFAQEHNKVVKYRPHPRYSNMVLLKKYVKDCYIEDPKEVNILTSVSNLDYAVGSYTTVLSQAYFSGKKVILDDVTFKDQYFRLQDFEYILANKGLSTLSEFQNANISDITN